MRAASLTIWSKAGWMKSANWISATGMVPFMAAPMATPTMLDSASGGRGGRRLGVGDRLVAVGRALLLDPVVVLLGRHTLVEQVAAEALDGVAAEQRLELGLGPVAALVVVGGVGGEAGDLGRDQG